jgi:hypothetical protein
MSILALFELAGLHAPAIGHFADFNQVRGAAVWARQGRS